MHPNEERLHDIYERIAADIAGVLAMCDDAITFHVPGRTPFSGVHTKADFRDWLGKMEEIAGGTFGEKVVEIIANDEHGVVLLDQWLVRHGRRTDYRAEHIWDFRDGVLMRFRERFGDEEAFNQVWT